MVVIYIAPGGKANYKPCIVQATDEQTKHYTTTRKYAKTLGLEVVIVIDENEPLFEPFLNIVDWATVPTVDGIR